MVRKVVALGDVEDGVAPEERHSFAVLFIRPWRRSPLRVGASLALGDKFVGVTDRDAVFALAHRAPEANGLTKGEPVLRRKTLIEQVPPKDQHIDAGIELAGCGIAREPERGVLWTRAPWLRPRKDASFQIGNDARGDLLVETGFCLLPMSVM